MLTCLDVYFDACFDICMNKNQNNQNVKHFGEFIEASHFKHPRRKSGRTSSNQNVFIIFMKLNHRHFKQLICLFG